MATGNIIRSHIKECLIELGFSGCDININLIYKYHLNDISDMHYNKLIQLYSSQLAK